jgi:hypothetical protein
VTDTVSQLTLRMRPLYFGARISTGHRPLQAITMNLQHDRCVTRGAPLRG